MEHLNITTEILDVEEARSRLPLVRAHVETIMEATHELQSIHRRLSSEAETLGDRATRDLRERGKEAEERFKSSLRAMNDLGAYLKDPATGLLDFYSWRNGELVFLCWRHGEADISYWHGLHDGFSGRQPID